MEAITNLIQGTLGLSSQIQTRLIASLIAVLLLIILRKVVLSFVKSRTKDIALRYRWQKTSAYVAFGIGVFIVGSIWFQGFNYLSTYLGLLSAGLAIALQTPLVNLAGWVFILWRRPFSVGDRIEIGNVKGDVIDQRVFMFSLMEIGSRVDAEQSTGRILHIPNGKVFTEPLANYADGFPFIWNEIPVLITFESNWKLAKEIMNEIASNRGEGLSENAENEIRNNAGKMMIFVGKLTPIVHNC